MLRTTVDFVSWLCTQLGEDVCVCVCVCVWLIVVQHAVRPTGSSVPTQTSASELLTSATDEMIAATAAMNSTAVSAISSPTPIGERRVLPCACLSVCLSVCVCVCSQSYLLRWVGTNLIDGEKCVISRDVSENMPDFNLENSRKEFQKFTENSRAPQTLFRGAVLMQTKKSVEECIWNFWTTNIDYIYKY